MNHEKSLTGGTFEKVELSCWTLFRIYSCLAFMEIYTATLLFREMQKKYSITTHSGTLESFCDMFFVCGVVAR